MSLVRRTSVAAVAVTGLVLASRVMTLVASGATGTCRGAHAAPHAATAKSHWRWGSPRPGWPRSSSRPSAARRTGRPVPDATATGSSARSRCCPTAAAADPTVARYAGGWVAVSTGPGAPRGRSPRSRAARGRTSRPRSPCSRAGRSAAATGPPTWSRSTASGSSTSPPRWPGSASTGAASAWPPPPTRPAPSCPTSGRWSARSRPPRPAAYDRIKRRGRDMPQSGVIDPDFFKDQGGHQYLLYRTQSTPSSIRMVELPASGLPEGVGAQHRAGPPRRRDREPDDAAPRPPVRPAHLRGRLRRVQLQDHLPALLEARRTGRGPSARSLVDSQEERAVRPRRCRPGPRSRTASRCCSSTPGPAPSSAATVRAGTTTTATAPLRRPAVAVRGRAAVHQPAVTAESSRTSRRSCRHRRRPGRRPRRRPGPDARRSSRSRSRAADLAVRRRAGAVTDQRRSRRAAVGRRRGAGRLVVRAACRGLAAERLLGDVGLGVDERVVADPADDALAGADEVGELRSRSRRSSRRPCGRGWRSRRSSRRRSRPPGRCRRRSGRTPRRGRCSRR